MESDDGTSLESPDGDMLRSRGTCFFASLFYFRYSEMVGFLWKAAGEVSSQKRSRLQTPCLDDAGKQRRGPIVVDAKEVQIDG